MSYTSNNKNSDQQTAAGQATAVPITGEIYSFTQDEVVFIENVLVELRTMMSNDMGENMAIMEKIVLAEQIIGARLDPQSAEIGDSG